MGRRRFGLNPDVGTIFMFSVKGRVGAYKIVDLFATGVQRPRGGVAGADTIIKWLARVSGPIRIAIRPDTYNKMHKPPSLQGNCL